MKRSKNLQGVIKIAKYTIADEVRQKSFVIMFFVCALIVIFLRSCYQGQSVVNGPLLNTGTMAGTISKGIFYAIAIVAMLIAALLSMRIFRRERGDGMQSCILSKPINRWQYVVGKVLGLWVLSMLFMFILHGIVFVITSFHMKVLIPEYILASLLCSLNLLFVIIAVLFLSLLMPDVFAFLSAMGIAIGSLVADLLYAININQSQLQSMAQLNGTEVQPELTWWKIVCYLWPKLSGVQKFASSLFGNEGFQGLRSLYPLINVLFYCLVLGALLVWRFRNEDVV